jgi:hypothetical protein
MNIPVDDWQGNARILAAGEWRWSGRKKARILLFTGVEQFPVAILLSAPIPLAFLFPSRPRVFFFLALQCAERREIGESPVQDLDHILSLRLAPPRSPNKGQDMCRDSDLLFLGQFVQ